MKFSYYFTGNKSKYSKKLDVKTTQDNDKGRNIFQPNFINWSYLYLGTIALTNEKRINNISIFKIIHIGPGIILKGNISIGDNHQPSNNIETKETIGPSKSAIFCCEIEKLEDIAAPIVQNTASNAPK